MQGDRELLELAAKAAGPEAFNLYMHGKWNPLTDDGDALRLAVTLNIQVAPDPANSMACAWLASESDAEPIEETIAVELWRDSDPLAATRRAIVRAAAELGKQATSDNKGGLG